MRTILSRLSLLSLILALAGPANAVDGVLEINQTCAVQTGCFAGDAAGFPVTIGTGGSYRLTSNLGMTNLDVTAILVSASNVTLDLGGFRVLCTIFTPPFDVAPCGSSEAGSGRGVDVVVFSPVLAGIEVRNGSIVGMRGDGVRLGDRSVVRDLRISQNGRNGVIVGIGSIVSRNTVSQNGNDGILAGAGSRISGNTITENGLHGIDIGDDCLVLQNTVRQNGERGLFVGTGTGYRENVINGNALSTVLGGINMGANICNGLTTCP